MLMFGCKRQTLPSRNVQMSCDTFGKKLTKLVFLWPSTNLHAQIY